jgi:hypothetical protein
MCHPSGIATRIATCKQLPGCTLSREMTPSTLTELVWFFPCPYANNGIRKITIQQGKSLLNDIGALSNKKKCALLTNGAILQQPL